MTFGYLSKKKTSLKNLDIAKKARNEKCRNKTDILTRAVSTGVLTNRVFFFFCGSSKFAFFAENIIKIGVSAKTGNKKKVVLKIGPRLC